MPTSPRYGGTWKYCSMTCHKERNKRVGRDKWNEKAPPHRVVQCVVCQESFTTPSTQKKYCGKKCYVRATRLKQAYGISPKDYRDLIDSQNGLCASCRLPLEEKTHIDHCHEGGSIRGVLHPGCNVAIGHFAEDVGKCLSAAEYLTRHQFDLRDLCVR